MKKKNNNQIKNRMINKAAALWGVSANEIEMSFDPLVSLLISATASEIENISSEIKESQIRITEKLIQLMTPETIYGPRPAHAIMYTEPVDSFNTIHPEFLFYHKKRTQRSKTAVNLKNVYFSPVKSNNITNAKIKYLATGNNIIELNSNKNLQTIYNNSSINLPPSTLYLGISSEFEKIDISQISFYFELLNIENKELFYHHLSNAQWFINDVLMSTTSGFLNSEEKSADNIDSIFGDTSSKTYTISNDVINLYERHFITNKSNTILKQSNHSELDTVIKDNKIELEGDVKWIKIVFSQVISNETLKDVFCSLNCFPVLNRELITFSFQMKKYIDILPIKNENLFLDIKSITNTVGKVYKPQTKNNTHDDKGTYIVRNENMGKLDHRNAKEYIAHLIELLKRESASFSLINKEFLQAKLTDLNQIISLLEKKLEGTFNEATQTNYIVLKPYKSREKILTEYWTTSGKFANNIKSGNALEIYKGIGIKQKSSILITTTFGGKNELTMKDRLDAYRRSLLSRDRIVTKEDIKAVCYEFYSDKIKKVEVKNGYSTDISLKKGLVQCIEIMLHPNPKIKTELYEFESINSKLLSFLEKNSTSVFPFKIKIIS